MKEIIVEQKMLCHMAFTTAHQMKYEYTIKGEGLLNDRKFYGEFHTPKRKNSFNSWGKTSCVFYFAETPKGGEFKDIPSLLASKDLILSKSQSKQ